MYQIYPPPPPRYVVSPRTQSLELTLTLGHNYVTILKYPGWILAMQFEIWYDKKWGSSCPLGSEGIYTKSGVYRVNEYVVNDRCCHMTMTEGYWQSSKFLQSTVHLKSNLYESTHIHQAAAKQMPVYYRYAGEQTQALHLRRKEMCVHRSRNFYGVPARGPTWTSYGTAWIWNNILWLIFRQTYMYASRCSMSWTTAIPSAGECS